VLIAEELLLLLLDDQSGATKSSFMRPGLGGALLVELAMAECVLVGPRRRWTGAKVSAVIGVPIPEDPLLHAAYATVAAKPQSAQSLVNALGKNLQSALAERLAQEGMLERRESRVLGLFRRTRWPARDTLYKEQVRRSVAAALVEGQEPDPRTAALIALLSALDRAHKTVDRGGVSSREIKRRARKIAEGDWAAKGVRDAIQAATAAVMVTVTAAGGAAAASSGS
jgi:hypothetical protein